MMANRPNLSQRLVWRVNPGGAVIPVGADPRSRQIEAGIVDLRDVLADRPRERRRPGTPAKGIGVPGGRAVGVVEVERVHVHDPPNPVEGRPGISLNNLDDGAVLGRRRTGTDMILVPTARRIEGVDLLVGKAERQVANF